MKIKVPKFDLNINWDAFFSEKGCTFMDKTSCESWPFDIVRIRETPDTATRDLIESDIRYLRDHICWSDHMCGDLHLIEDEPQPVAQTFWTRIVNWLWS